MINLKSFQRQQQLGMPDLLPYAVLVDEGVILNKDGSYMASWWYEGRDDNSMTPHDRNVTNDRINKALMRLGSGWCIHINASRVQTEVYPDKDLSKFNSAVAALIDDERREFFNAEGNSFQTRYSITITFTPEPDLHNKAESLFFSVEGEKSKAKPTTGDKILEQFKRSCKEFEENMSIVLRMQRMKTIKGELGGVEVEYDEQLSMVDQCFHQEEHRPVIIPHCGMYVDSYIGRYQFATGVTPRIGKKFIKVLSIDGFPSATHAGFLNALSEIGLEFRWSTRFIPLDAYQANNEIKKYTRKWNQKVKGFIASMTDKPNAKVNRTALNMTVDAEMAESDASGDQVNFGYYTGNIIIMSEDSEYLERAASAARKSLLRLGFSGARIEDINAVDAWLGTFPANSFCNIRRPLIHSLNLADLIPTSAVYAGEMRNPCPFYPKGSPPLATVKTDGSTPFRLNLHVSDLAHTLIFGPTGSGKSTLLAFLTTQMQRYRNATIFAFDKGMSMYAVNQACGGNHYNIGAELEDSLPSMSFAPLSRIENDADFDWACEWIEILVNLQLKGGITVDHKMAIRAAMTQHRTSEYKRLSDYRTQVQDEEVKSALSFYAEREMYDADKDSLKDGSFEVFEIEELMNMQGEISLPIMLYMFRCIEKRLTGQPAFIIIDEAWLVLGHDVFRNKIREWLKVLRKANCGVVLATQSISDAANSGILDVLAESCPTKIFLPNDKANHEEFAEYYKRLGMNSAQRDIIADAIPKREYFVTTGQGDRLVDLGLGPVALAFCAKSSKEDLKAIKGMQKLYSDEWPAKWLESQTEEA